MTNVSNFLSNNKNLGGVFFGVLGGFFESGGVMTPPLCMVAPPVCLPHHGKNEDSYIGLY